MQGAIVSNELMTAKEVAIYWGVHIRTVFRWAKAKNLTTKRIGRRTLRFMRSEVVKKP